ncbi:MAG: IS5/IS1182 family transposase, partial [Sphaerotilus natans subsp. sulfidivorans]|nr:IS5/IS1182 family transposase [Sphaerotilus sulfidivorans]
FERQVVELHVRVAVLNRFSQIGRPQTVPVGAVA